MHIWLRLTSIFSKCQFHFWLTFLKLSFILCFQCLRLGLRKLNKEEKKTPISNHMLILHFFVCLFLSFYRSFFIFHKDANLENVCMSTKITNQTMQTSSGMLFLACSDFIGLSTVELFHPRSKFLVWIGF